MPMGTGSHSYDHNPIQGVIRLEECYEDENSVHLVTELCAGGDLQKYVEVSTSLGGNENLESQV